MSQKIYAGNLSTSTTDSNIFDHFSKIGKVYSVELAKGIDGKTNVGYGYVTMGSEKDMEEAINKLNNSKLDGNNIRVVKAHPLDNGYVFRNERTRRFKRH